MNVQYADVEGIMKIELTITKSKDLPRGTLPALEKELLKRLKNQYENCSLVNGNARLQSSRAAEADEIGGGVTYRC